VVAADIEDLVALQVKVAVEGLGEHFIRSYLIAKKDSNCVCPQDLNPLASPFEGDSLVL